MSDQNAGFLASPPKIIATVTTIIAGAMFLAPVPEGFPPEAYRGAALGLFAVGLYATVAIPEHLTALAFFTIAMIFGVAPAEVVFSGFHSTAFWLVFGGLIVGVAVNKTGLGKHLATGITKKLGGGYLTLLIGMAAVGIALAFLMPSTMGRIILLMPIVLALADHKGYVPGRPERTGLVLAMAAGTWMPSSGILPANVPNMVLIGVAENLYDIGFTYGNYLLTHFPTNGIVKVALIIAVIAVLFPGKDAEDLPEEEPTKSTLSADGRKLGLILGLTLALWVTDFIHGISPAWIAMLAAVVCLMPGVGLVDTEDLKTKVNFPSTLYVAGVLSLGLMLVETGAGDWIGTWLLKHVPLSEDAPLQSFFAMVGLGTLLNMTSTAASVPALVAPLADDMAAMTGMPLKTVLMTQVIAYTTIILPYQAPPIIVAMQLGGVSMKDASKFTAVLAVISLIVLVPLNYVWWSILGLL